MDDRIYEAAAAWTYEWPAQLESGVMFYKGLRITRAQFSAVRGKPFGPITPESIDEATITHNGRSTE